ncbi:MAG: hypothetical protein DSY47_02205 [Hydrogenothermus sp.]|nr:MAG: hypothetical protein DSY47_02205 [Hydrogenothermus sp.]
MFRRLNTFFNVNIPHSLKYNPYLDGLRGISISLVVLFHFFPELFPFGFIGVDIFFVLSGYLITLIIVSKLNKNNFSLKEFYRNRARRLFPALIFILIFSLIVGYLFLFTYEYKNLGKHVKASALYYQNFNLINEVGYWDKEAIYKPLLHIWSLSVEEQFYFFWPFLLITLYKFRKLNTHYLLVLFLILFSFSVYYFHIASEKAFYNTFSRGWELTLGGIAALLYFYSKDYLAKYLSGKIFFPLFILAVPIVFFTHIYSPLKILIFLILIVIWILRTNFYRDLLLGNKILIFLGLISYSLYLWHYVLLSFLHIFGFTSYYMKFFILFLSLLLSTLTFRFIELPFRKKESYKFSLLLFFMLIFVAILGYIIYIKNGIPDRPINEYVKEQQLYFKRDKAYDKNCLDIATSILGRKPLFFYCRATSKDAKAFDYAIVGDSHAHTIYTGLARLLMKQKKDVILLANSGCPPYIDSYRGKTLRDTNVCERKIQDIYNVLNNLNIKTLIMTTRIAIYMSEKGYGITERSFSKRPTRYREYYLNAPNYNPSVLFLEKLAKTFQYFKNKNIKIIFILENPELGFDPKRCLKRWFLPIGNSCKIDKKEYLKRQQKYREQIKKIAKKFDNAVVVDIEDIFCDNKYCYVYKNGKSLYADDDHISLYGSFLIAKKVIKILK